MTEILTPAQQAWLEAQVASGALPSVEDGIRAAIADMMMLADDDLGWAQPYVDEARASIERGEVLDGDAFLSRLRERVERTKSA